MIGHRVEEPLPTFSSKSHCGIQWAVSIQNLGTERQMPDDVGRVKRGGGVWLDVVNMYVVDGEALSGSHVEAASNL